MRHADFDELARALRSRAGLLGGGWSERDISRGLSERTLRRVRRGWYIDGRLWDSLWGESRHLAVIIAVARDASGPIVFSHASAAVLWGLPWWGSAPARAHVMVGPVDRSSGCDVFRHEGALEEGHVRVRHGLRCTSLERTLVDVARTAGAECAISVADAGFQKVAGNPRDYDADAAEAWREELRGLLAAPGRRGIRLARRIVDIADGRAELPGESVSRLQLLRLGFTRLDIQVPVETPRGRYWIDFGLGRAQAWGEFDGKDKYLDEATRAGLSIEEVVLREKQREDWIRGTTQRRFVRWNADHIGTPAALEARLASFGIRPPALTPPSVAAPALVAIRPSSPPLPVEPTLRGRPGRGGVGEKRWARRNEGVCGGA